MASNYPNGIDTFVTHTDNNSENILADHVNKLQLAMVAVQQELENFKVLYWMGE